MSNFLQHKCVSRLSDDPTQPVCSLKKICNSKNYYAYHYFYIPREALCNTFIQLLYTSANEVTCSTASSTICRKSHQFSEFCQSWTFSMLPRFRLLYWDTQVISIRDKAMNLFTSASNWDELKTDSLEKKKLWK